MPFLTGPYSLQTSRTAGYQDLHYDPEAKGGQFPPFSLKEREQRGGIEFKVKQACRISGKVFDEQGKLPHDVGKLTVYAWVKSDDGKLYRPEHSTINESDCSYVIDGLSDKPVYVMALVRRAPRGVDTWPPIYYPSTFSRSQAKLVTFEKGRNVENVNITRRRGGGLVIAGTVRDPSGKPIPEALVAVHHRDMLFDQASAYSDGQGRYEIQGLCEGELLMHVDAAFRGFVRTGLPITLDGSKPKTEQNFTLAQGVSISGKFVDRKGNAWEIAESVRPGERRQQGQRKARFVERADERVRPQRRQASFRRMVFCRWQRPLRRRGHAVSDDKHVSHPGCAAGAYADHLCAAERRATSGRDPLRRPRHTQLGHRHPTRSSDRERYDRDRNEGIASGRRHQRRAVEQPEKKGGRPAVVRGEQEETVLGVRPQGNCSIGGQVVSEATGKPVEGARMHLHYDVTHGSIFVDTDSDGKFEIKNIPTGPFSLRSSHTPGYQDAAYNPEGKPAQSLYVPFSLRGGEHRTGIALKIKPACRISGKIMDENGKPPEGKTLGVLAWSKNDAGVYRSNQAWSTVSMVLTRSTASVTSRSMSWQSTGKPQENRGDARPPIYYPGTFSRSNAKQFSFDKSTNVDGVNITLRKEGGLALEGTIRDEAGKPIPEAFVVVHRLDMLFDFNTAYSDAQGHYRIQGMGTGQFLVHVDAVHRGFVRTRKPIDIDKPSEKS